MQSIQVKGLTRKLKNDITSKFILYIYITAKYMIIIEIKHCKVTYFWHLENIAIIIQAFTAEIFIKKMAIMCDIVITKSTVTSEKFILKDRH